MTTHPRAGKPASQNNLIDVDSLIRAYSEREPDPRDPMQKVTFGTSGHRGSSIERSFNCTHILAVSQAVCDFRKTHGINGPLYVGIDSHALSRPALETTLGVLIANDTETFIQANEGLTPTPVISHAILAYNRGRDAGFADGIVITPSHNPPQDGGFKYNPPNGGPASQEITVWIENRANDLLAERNRGVKSVSYERALTSPFCHLYDFVKPYVDDLRNVLDMDTIYDSQLRMGVDPMGGASLAFWNPIAEAYRLNIEIVNTQIDPQFGFMSVDRDGQIRMDCSSPYAMASLIRLKYRFDIAFGNDPDSDRHGIVTPSAGLMNPNHYLSVAIEYLFSNRPLWKQGSAVGKTLVSSSMVDRVAAKLRRKLIEVPVGFKWFVDGLLTGALGFAGEESAGASFVRHDGRVWTTDKDGIILCLLAAEITAKTGRDPGMHYQDLTHAFGAPLYERIDAPSDAHNREILKYMTPEQVRTSTLAGEPILQKLTHAPGNGASIGGLKVVTQNGWFAARPSGTENIYKIYTESFLNEQHLARLQSEAKAIIQDAIETAGKRAS